MEVLFGAEYLNGSGYFDMEEITRYLGQSKKKSLAVSVFQSLNKRTTWSEKTVLLVLPNATICKFDELR